MSSISKILDLTFRKYKKHKIGCFDDDLPQNNPKDIYTAKKTHPRPKTKLNVLIANRFFCPPNQRGETQGSSYLGSEQNDMFPYSSTFDHND